MSIQEVRDKLLFAVTRNTMRHQVQFKRMCARCIKGGGRINGFRIEEVRYDFGKRYLRIKRRALIRVRIGGLDYTNLD